MILGREPTLITAFIAIAISLLVSFGLHLTTEQVELINALVIAGASIVVRQVVTPVARPSLPEGTEVKVVAASGESTTQIL